MAFTYDPTTSRGLVRLYIQDTDTETAANQLFTDAEIDAFLSSEGDDVFAAAASALRALAASAARMAILFRLLGGETTVDRKAVADNLLKVAKELDDKAGQSATTSEFVSWGLELDPMDGRDETTYEDTDDMEYQDVHIWNKTH